MHQKIVFQYYLFNLSCVLFSILPSFNPVNTAAETVFCHYRSALFFFVSHSLVFSFNKFTIHNAYNAAKRWTKKKTHSLHERYYVVGIQENVECDENIDKVYILFTLSGVSIYIRCVISANARLFFFLLCFFYFTSCNVCVCVRVNASVVAFFLSFILSN